MDANQLFHSYQDPRVSVCTGTRNKEDKLPGVELGIIEHITAKPADHCMRIWGDQTLAQTIQGFREAEQTNVQGLGGINFYLSLAAIGGLAQDNTLLQMPTKQWPLRSLAEGCAKGRGWPIWPSYPRAAIGARTVAGAARFNPVAKLRPDRTSLDDVLDMTIDDLRDIGPSKGLPVLNWTFEYRDADGSVKDFAQQPFTVESVYSDPTALKPTIRGVESGVDLAMIAVDRPFGDSSIRLGVDIGGRAGGTIGAALWHQHLVEPSISKTTRYFTGIFENTVKREPTPFEIFRFTESLASSTAKARNILARCDANRVTGAIFVTPVHLASNMAMQVLDPPHGFTGPDAWLKIDGAWRMASAA